MLEGETCFGLEEVKPQPDPLADDLGGSFFKDGEALCMQFDVHSLIALGCPVMVFHACHAPTHAPNLSTVGLSFPAKKGDRCDFGTFSFCERQIFFPLLFTAHFSHSCLF